MLRRRPGGLPYPRRALRAAPSNTTGGVLPLVTNASAPQVVDYALAAGFAFIIAAAAGPSGGPSGAEYQHGAHAAAVHSAETLKSDVWASTRGVRPAIGAFAWVGQQVDLTQQGWIQRSSPGYQGGGAVSSKYKWGVDALTTLGAETGKSQVWEPVTASVSARLGQVVLAAPQQADLTQQPLFDAPVVGRPGPAPFTAAPPPFDFTQQGWVQRAAPGYQGPTVGGFTAGPQQADLTLQASLEAPTTALTGPVLLLTQGAPQFADLTLQASFTSATVNRATLPPFTQGAPQVYDLTQQACISRSAPGYQGPTVSPFTGGPQFADLTQQGQIFESVSAPAIATPVGGAEYWYGGHAAATQAAEDQKTQVWESVAAPPPTPAAQLGKFVRGAPQAADLTQQADFSQPLIGTVPPTGPVFTWILSHAEDGDQSTVMVLESLTSPPLILGDFVAASPQIEDRPTAAVWRSLIAPATPKALGAFLGTVAQFEDRSGVRTWPAQLAGQTLRVPPLVSGAPQQADLTLQASLQSSLPGYQGQTVKPFIGGPLQVDLTQQGLLSAAVPVPPVVSYALPQAFAAPQAVDLTQQGWIRGPVTLAQGKTPPLVWASPQFADLTQQASLTPSAWSPLVVSYALKSFYAAPQPDLTQAAAIWPSIAIGTVAPPVLDVGPTLGRHHKHPLPSFAKQDEANEHRLVREKWDAIEAKKPRAELPAVEIQKPPAESPRVADKTAAEITALLDKNPLKIGRPKLARKPIVQADQSDEEEQALLDAFMKWFLGE